VMKAGAKERPIIVQKRIVVCEALMGTPRQFKGYDLPNDGAPRSMNFLRLPASTFA
jgi:hypothetical protein